jgi:hypothetical protein
MRRGSSERSGPCAAHVLELRFISSALRDFHSLVVHFEGQAGGKGWHLERLRDRDMDGMVQLQGESPC